MFASRKSKNFGHWLLGGSFDCLGLIFKGTVNRLTPATEQGKAVTLISQENTSMKDQQGNGIELTHGIGSKG